MFHIVIRANRFLLAFLAARRFDARFEMTSFAFIQRLGLLQAQGVTILSA
jgi:hypothetical protein